MKRLFVLFAFLLLSCAFHAQDVKAQSEGTLLIVPRLDAEPAYYFGDKEWSFNLGATSLYTVFDGNLGDYFSFSFSNHWFAYTNSFQDTKDLYLNTWRADAFNWVDWANVSVHFGNFSITAGKDYIHMGTFENDAYDFDSHWQLNSSLWNNYQVYQWGGSFGWTSSDESGHVRLQVTTDQLQERPFGSRNWKDYAYNLFGYYGNDAFKVMGSFMHCSIGFLGSLGVEGYLSDAVTLGADGYISKNYGGASLRVNAQLGEHVDLFVKGGFDKGSNSLIIDGTRFYCGTGLYWYPLRDNRDLRVHGLFAYDGGDNAIDFSAGITYQLNLKIF